MKLELTAHALLFLMRKLSQIKTVLYYFSGQFITKKVNVFIIIIVLCRKTISTSFYKDLCHYPCVVCGGKLDHIY